MIGTMIGNTYQLTEKLGEGGMGAVFKGIDVNLHRPVAVKVLRQDLAGQPELVERFRSEALTLARLNHPNVATLYSFLPQGGQFFMVMEFVAGETLEAIIRRFGKMNFRDAIPLFCQALEGIEHAHQFGIVHRDLKPANLMVTVEGSRNQRVKVMDFGIARILGTSRMTRTGGVVGTLHYMSPEQAKGQDTDARSDIYSLGIVLYEMLTGTVPFTSHSEYELMKAHIEKAPPPPRTLTPDIPAALEQVVLKALAKDPRKRFQSAQAFRATLQEVNAVGETRVEPKKTTGIAWKPIWKLVAGGAAGLAGLGMTIYLLFPGPKPPNPTPSDTPPPVVQLDEGILPIAFFEGETVNKPDLMGKLSTYRSTAARERMAAEIEKKQVDFEIAPETERELTQAGADPRMIQAIRRGRSNYEFLDAARKAAMANATTNDAATDTSVQITKPVDTSEVRKPYEQQQRKPVEKRNQPPLTAQTLQWTAAMESEWQRLAEKAANGEATAADTARIRRLRAIRNQAKGN